MNSIIYGPVDSRRLGQSLGINLAPREIVGAKICTFDCLYCYAGKTEKKDLEVVMNFDVISRQLREGIKKVLDDGIRFDAITFAGSGEPTNYVQFSELLEYLIAIKKEYKIAQPIALFTNSTALTWEKLSAISKIDRVFFKLDAGDEETFQRINNPRKEIHLDDIIEALKIVRKSNGQLCVSTAVMPQNIESLKNDSFYRIIKKIQPKHLYLYDIDYQTADGFLTRSNKNDLENLKRILEKITAVEILQHPKGRGIHPLFCCKGGNE
jgi:wyosine [tRNA(Phe)-imidazoG37] synthetase (radical SAM superfamily)